MNLAPAKSYGVYTVLLCTRLPQLLSVTHMTYLAAVIEGVYSFLLNQSSIFLID